MDQSQYFGSIDQASGVNATMFDEAKETRLNCGDGLGALRPGRQPAKRPNRQSSLRVENQLPFQCVSQRMPPTLRKGTAPSDSVALGTTVIDFASAQEVVAEGHDASSMRRAHEYVTRAKQPLPMLPPQALVKDPSQTALGSQGSATVPSALAASSSKRSSAQSKRSSRPHRKSPAVSHTASSRDTRCESVLSEEAKWEEDVEYCYQQEAESTCDFDWQFPTALRESSFVDSDGGGAARSSWLAPSPSSCSGSIVSHQSRGSTEPTTKPPASHAHIQPSSTGHRGFSAARTASPNRAKNTTPPAPAFSKTSPLPSIPSPTFSTAPSADHDLAKPASSPNILSFRGYDSAQQQQQQHEYLSDPESVRTGSSQHSQSSSYGSSLENVARPVGLAKARWSMASASSVPELLHSKRRSRVSLVLQKGAVSRPLETLPQSPLGAEGGGQGAERDAFAGARLSRGARCGGEPRSSRYSRSVQGEGGRQRAAAPAPGWI
ncbi:hypothetical protein LTR08_005983 [Meristemomyces frigidus]|nr:hypothetical protein LTR08_005983 [Meristemomyces frigidus]